LSELVIIGDFVNPTFFPFASYVVSFICSYVFIPAMNSCGEFHSAAFKLVD